MLCYDKSLQPCTTLKIPWTGACQAPPSRAFSRQEYWSGLPCPPPGCLPNPGIKPRSLTSPVLASGFFTTSITQEAPKNASYIYVLRHRKKHDKLLLFQILTECKNIGFQEENNLSAGLQYLKLYTHVAKIQVSQPNLWGNT